MNREQFIKNNSSAWKELENFESKINKNGTRALSSEEVSKFLHSYRLCSHHLAYSRTHYPKSDTESFLNSLLGRCHSFIYAVPKATFLQTFKYIFYGFPKLLKEYRGYVLCSFVFFAIGVFLSLIIVLLNKGNALLFLPKSIIDGTISGKSGSGSWNDPLMSSYIMVNNISVSLRAFVYGITLGLGTIYVLFSNGTTLGSLTAITYQYGNPLIYWSLILPHGIIELTAVFISGAAGLVIAKSILIPGDYSRLHSVVLGAKKAVSLLLGVAFMLVIAAIIEGFFTPLKINPVPKLIFAAITAVLMMAYFSIPYFVKDNDEVRDL